MKKIVIAALLLCLKLNVYSQTIATDFNLNDCTGTSYHLFGELDAGKVIVLCFVMPCVGCISPANTTGNVAAGFAGSHPNKVHMYLVDDEGDNTCSLLASWRNANGLGMIPTFSDTTLVQGLYGSPGMPKIVVLGGSGHYVYDVEDNVVDSVKLTNAINAALSGVVPAPIPNAVRQPLNISHVSLSPNPARDHLTLSCHLVSAGDVRMDIFDAAGNYVKTIVKEGQHSGDHAFAINTEGLSNGTYVLRMNVGESLTQLKFVIRK